MLVHAYIIVGIDKKFITFKEWKKPYNNMSFKIIILAINLLILSINLYKQCFSEDVEY